LLRSMQIYLQIFGGGIKTLCFKSECFAPIE
jgi:hypothetical protein